MKTELREITPANREAVCALEVSPSQKAYIASNRESLETAAREEHRDVARPFAIYAENTLVGFAMFAFDLSSPDPDDRYWLWRFMIHRDLQGRGCGTSALKTIIAYFQNHGADHILLSTKESNTGAVSLYRRFGFRETGEVNGDETVFRLRLKK